MSNFENKGENILFTIDNTYCNNECKKDYFNEKNTENIITNLDKIFTEKKYALSLNIYDELNEDNIILKNYNNIPKKNYFNDFDEFNNITLKELLIICDYYGILKLVKKYKFTKKNIIALLMEFENDSNNLFIVSKRKNVWFYVNELKNDHFMKKFVLW